MNTYRKSDRGCTCGIHVRTTSHNALYLEYSTDVITKFCLRSLSFSVTSLEGAIGSLEIGKQSGTHHGYMGMEDECHDSITNMGMLVYL